MRLEPTISTLTAIRSIQMAKLNIDGYRIRKSEDLKSILFIMFANLKLVLRSYTSLYGIFMSASLTLYIYIITIIIINNNIQFVWTVGFRKKCSLRAGFEPARAMPIVFQVQRLNHSAITAAWYYLNWSQFFKTVFHAQLDWAWISCVPK